jgi:hypothetical protein
MCDSNMHGDRIKILKKRLGFDIKIKSCVIIRDTGPHKIWLCIQAVPQ